MEFILKKGGNVNIFIIKKGQENIENSNEIYKYLKERELFKGNLGETYFHIQADGNNSLLLGLGEEKDLNVDSIRTAFFKAGKELMKSKVESINIKIEDFNKLDLKDIALAIAEGLLQSEYAFEKYLSEKKTKPSLKQVYIHGPEENKTEISEAISEAKDLVEGIFLTRELVNERAINMYPEILAKSAEDNLSGLGVDVKVYGKKEIEAMEMKAFLAVAEGSEKEPKFIVMEYNGNPDSTEKLALVGKGITYDSGGYSLKPTPSMDTMFTDMAGSATVIGALKSIAKSKLKKNVVGVVAACENLISGGAYKPGDIIGSMSGKTIEVLNTDAEGRITLADALWYATKELKADKIIDLATLTGACVVALGSLNSGAITNNDALMKEIKKAANLAGENIWQLPSNKEYKELIKGDFGDLKNTGGRGAGTITAGLFLEEFVDDTPWVHLDIAGTAYIDKPSGYLPKGATGVHVKTLYYLVKNM